MYFYIYIYNDISCHISLECLNSECCFMLFQGFTNIHRQVMLSLSVMCNENENLQSYAKHNHQILNQAMYQVDWSGFKLLTVHSNVQMQRPAPSKILRSWSCKGHPSGAPLSSFQRYKITKHTKTLAIGSLVHWLVGWVAGWLAGWLVGWLVK